MGDCWLHLVLSGEEVEVVWTAGVSSDILSSDRMSYVDIVTRPPTPPVKSINGQVEVEVVLLIFTSSTELLC